jgi:hypothetical protein
MHDLLEGRMVACVQAYNTALVVAGEKQYGKGKGGRW